MLRAREDDPQGSGRRRLDVVAAVVLAVLLLGAGIGYAVSSPAANTESVPAGSAGIAPEAPTAVPAGFTEAWRAPSGAAPVPITAGPGVVTAEGGTVVGREAGTGAERWRYSRELPLCSAGEAFGRVLALYRNGEFCSELTALDPDLGTRRYQANPDARPGARLITAGSQVAATGPDYLETLRSDLVTTLQYGAVVAPAEPGRQPRQGCSYSSFAIVSGRLGLIEHCPGEPADRLTVLGPDATAEASTPDVESSTLLGSTGASLIALSAERALLLLPEEPALQIVDSAAVQVGLIPLDGPVPDAAPPDGIAHTSSDSARVYWWSGAQTIALERTSLTPVWSLSDSLGAGTAYAGRWLVPVPEGIAVVDPVDGTVERTIPVDRSGYAGGIVLAAKGPVLLEQRGAELVALTPSG